MKKYFVYLTVMALVVLTFGAFSMSTAQAKTASSFGERHNTIAKVTCVDGFNLDSDSYDASKANKFSWTVGDKSDAGTFPDSLHVSIPVPQDGATTSWAYDVQAEDGSYHFAESGTVGPCGEVPPPVKHARAGYRVVAYCNTVVVESRKNLQSLVRSQPNPKTHPYKWLFVGVADKAKNAIFGDGSTTKRTVIFQKHGPQCHNGSDGS